MPNKKGGKKFKKGKKNSSQFQKKLIVKNEADGVEDQEYAKVLRVNGSGRFQLLCFDGTERLGTVCGQMRKRVWVKLNDVVLVSLWTGIQDNKCTIIHKYDMDEAYKLRDMGEFPPGISIDEGVEEGGEDLFSMAPPSSEEDEEDEEEEEKPSEYQGYVKPSTAVARDDDFNFEDI